MTKSDIEKVEQVDRIARFQSFQAGEYWKAVEAIPKENIDEGEVLLIETIKWVDEKAHTVVVRSHPSKYGDYVRVKYVDEDNETQSRHVKCTSHHFLVDDFLSLFEHEPDAEKIREAELGEARAVIDGLQQKLVGTQSDPDKMQQIVDAGLAEKSKKDDKQNLPARPEDLHSLGQIVSGSVSDAVTSGLNEGTVDQLKVAIDQQRDIAEIKANWIKARTNEITSAVSRLTPFFEEKAAAALAATQDARTYAETLRKGIETLDLYVGNGVQVETISEGTDAGRDIPLSFVQKRLWMDEELAVFADVDEYFDFRDHEKFDEVLRAEPGLVDQIFPTERCVVAMATNRFVDYGEPNVNRVNNEANRHAFLMIRNGGNIHRVYSSIDSHGKTPRLFPSQDEQNRVFRGFDGKDINFDDVEFGYRYERHQNLSLHYKRFLILMAGLDHRLQLFGEFYPRDVGNNFVSMEFQETFCNFVHDDDGSGMLPGEKRPDFVTWLKEKNAQLRSGSRVLCHWSELLTHKTAPSACERTRWGDVVSRDRILYRPENSFDVLVTQLDKKEICVKIPVSGEGYNFKQRSFTSRVCLTAYEYDEFSNERFAFLVLDSVHPDDLRWYINNRDQRTGHVKYIRLFKRALQEVEKDRAEEAHARERLKVAIMNRGVAKDAATAESVVEKTVASWRASRRGLSFLKFDGEKPPRGWGAVMDLAATIGSDRDLAANEIEAFAREKGLSPLRVSLTGRGDFVLYASPSDEERDDRFAPFVWVHRINLGKIISETSRSWVVLPESDASEEVLREYPEADEWRGRKSDFRSPYEKADLFKRAEAGVEQIKEYVSGNGVFEKLAPIWFGMRDELTKDRVFRPSLAIPIGLFRDRWGEGAFLCLIARHPEQLLYKTAPSEEVQRAFRMDFCRIYEQKTLWLNRFDQRAQEGENWYLGLVSFAYSVTEKGHEPFGRTEGYSLDYPSGVSGKASFDVAFSAWKDKKEQEGNYLWIAPEVRGEDGSLAIDALLGGASSRTAGT